MPQAPRISPSMRRNVSHLAYLACFVRWQTILTLPSQPRGGSVGHDGERPLHCCRQVPRWRWQDSPAVWMVVWHCQGLVDFFSFCFLVIISCVYSIWKSPFLLLFLFGLYLEQRFVCFESYTLNEFPSPQPSFALPFWGLIWLATISSAMSVEMNYNDSHTTVWCYGR